MPHRSNALSDFAFMMREYQIHASTVDVEVLAQILTSHSRTLTVPSGETVAPRRRPAHDVFGLRRFPQCEVGRIVFLFLSVQLASGVKHVIQITSRQLSVMVVFVIFRYIEINRTVAFISISTVQDFFYQLNLFDDMPRSMGFDAGRQYVQLFHRLVVTNQVILYHLHRFQLFEAGFLGNLVFTIIGIVFQVTHISNVTHVTHLVSQVVQVAEKNIKRNCRTGMS